MKFPLSSFHLGLACGIGSHPGTGLMGPGDADGCWTNAAQPPWSTKTPLGRLGWWGRCSVSAGSPTRSSRLCRPGSESPRKTGAPCPRRVSLSEGSKNSRDISSPGLALYPGSLGLRSWPSTGTERCTLCTICSPPRLVFTLPPDGSSSALGRFWWRPSRCAAPSVPHRGTTTSSTSIGS